jgi:hypothetical protein
MSTGLIVGLVILAVVDLLAGFGGRLNRLRMPHLGRPPSSPWFLRLALLLSTVEPVDLRLR